MTGIRRSSRAKRQATSIYDDAKRDIEELEGLNSDTERMSDDEENDSDETEAESLPSNVDEQDDSSGEDSSGEENNPKPTSSSRRSPPSKPQKKSGKGGGLNNSEKVRRGRDGANARPDMIIPNRRRTQTALATLSRKILDDTEDSTNSLVAALLQSAKRPAGSKGRGTRANDLSVYTQRLQAIARGVVDEHKDDPNKAQIGLLNMLFRSVGGTIESGLDPKENILEEMTGDEWATVITELVDDMCHTPADCVLFCADPNGAVHAAAVESSKGVSTDEIDTTPSAAGVREYRHIYEEFWYVLGREALSGKSADADGDEESEDSSFAQANSFGAEIVRELVTRMTELITVGQPDIRAAATVAALQLGHALLNRTLELGNELEAAARQFQTMGGGKKTKQSSKAEMLRDQMGSLKRLRADLEEIVHSTVVQGVFMHRYRDSNMYIRAACIKALSRMSLQRPDLFLDDKYLKYFGWMMSDKAACVRVESLVGLKAPFDAHRKIAEGSLRRGVSSKIDPRAMENLLTRFLPRIVDCTIDVSVRVQEEAVALLRALVPHGIMEHLDEDRLWQQLNSRALAKDTTAKVRRDALYLVLDQLDSFDERPTTMENHDKPLREELAEHQLDALTSWIAHTLCDGSIPIENISIDVVDFVVQSLRTMPEHKALVTNWSVILSAISEDSTATTATDKRSQDRTDVAKHRVLVRLLSSAAEAEVGAVSNTAFLGGDIDPEMYELQQKESTGETSQRVTKASKSYSPGMAHEELSVALLKSLPELLVKFKGDDTLLQSITILSRYLLPSVCGLSQRQKDFADLLKNLSKVYMDTSDEIVMQNVALSLSFMSKDGQTRGQEARKSLRSLAIALCERGTNLMEAPNSDASALGNKRKAPSARRPSKRSRGDRGSLSSDDSSPSVDSEPASRSGERNSAVALCLKRLKVLSKRVNLKLLLRKDDGDFDDESTTLDDLINAAVKEAATQLEARLTREDGPVSNIWRSRNYQEHASVANFISETLSFLLSCVAWKVCVVHGEDGVLLTEDSDLTSSNAEDVEGDELEDPPTLVLREQLVKLLELCFSILPEESEGAGITKEQIAFSSQVQTSALNCTSDLRVLLPRQWADASSVSLRACALLNDGHLIGGSLRWFRKQEEKLLDIGRHGEENVDLTRKLLLPLGRSVAIDWRNGNRREAGVLLSHIAGSGHEASQLVSSITRVLKKQNDPVRLLEAHMACLMQCFEDWIQSEPEEVESDRPTDEEMAAFDNAERKHVERFALFGRMATRQCMSFGVGAWNDPKLSSGILNFLRKGISYAFSNKENDDLLLGCRLPFLVILNKYIARTRSGWTIQQQDEIGLVLNEREAELREHPDFSEVHEDDLASISSFRSAVGLKDDGPVPISPNSDSRDTLSVGDDSLGEGTSIRGMAPTPSSHYSTTSRNRHSKGSSAGSVRSRLSSAQHSLSPLLEEDGGSSSPSPSLPPRRGRRRRKGSFEGSQTFSTLGKSIIAEGSEAGDSEDESF